MTRSADFSIPAPTGTGRPPVVLQVLPALVTGGVERGTIDMAAALVRAGWRALVASAGGPMVRELDRVGAEHVQLPLASKNPLTIRRNAKLLAGLIERYSVDIVHARSRAPAWSAYWAAEQTKRIFVTTFHSAYGVQSRWKKRYNSVMARGQRVIAISEFVGQHALDTYDIPAERLRVVPRGIDLTRFDPAAVQPSRVIALASAWRLQDGLPVIMLPGRISRWKGHMALLDAVGMLGRRDFQVIFVGSEQQHPHFRDELINRIKRLGLERVVHLVGDCRDMAAAYMLADVVISASTEPEGFGRVSVEAQAMGRPLVATAHGGTRETVIDGDTGWLVPPTNIRDWAEAIEMALNLNEAERIALADRAREWVSSRFDTRIMCDTTIGIYEELLFPDEVARRA
jgi:glycosyltransferase involved in cell wall biosynthesis